MEFKLRVNGQLLSVHVEPNTPLLWVLREHLKLYGTKYGCGIGACGACMVHLDGVSAFSCQVPVSAVGVQVVTTIEGLSEKVALPIFNLNFESHLQLT